MDFEDFVEPEIAVTAVLTAALFSPRARKVIRKGMVYGMAGILTAGDVATAFGRSVRQGVKQAEEAPREATHPMKEATVHVPAETINLAKEAVTSTKPKKVVTAQRKVVTKIKGVGGRSA